MTFTTLSFVFSVEYFNQHDLTSVYKGRIDRNEPVRWHDMARQYVLPISAKVRSDCLVCPSETMFFLLQIRKSMEGKAGPRFTQTASQKNAERSKILPCRLRNTLLAKRQNMASYNNPNREYQLLFFVHTRDLCLCFYCGSKWYVQ